MKKFFCVLLCTAYLTAAVWCAHYSYVTYTDPLQEGFTVYAPFQRKVFDLNYDEIKQIRFLGQREPNGKVIDKVVDARKTPDKLKEWVDYFNEYRYTIIKPARDFRTDRIPGRWYESVEAYIEMWKGTEYRCIVTKNFLRMGRIRNAEELRKDPFCTFRGTLLYCGDTSRIFEAVYE